MKPFFAFLQRFIAFLQRFRRVRNPIFDRSSFDFKSVDVTKSERSLRLKELGDKNGRTNIPAPSDTEPDGTERRIHQYIEKEIAETKASIEVSLMGLDEQLARLDCEPLLKDMEQAPDVLRASYNNLRQEYELSIQRAKIELDAGEREYMEFKHSREITRDPLYPESRVNRFGIALGIVAAESLLNAWFFATGSELGLIGGVFAACIFAITDILVSFNLGRLVMKLSVPRLSYKILGSIGAFTFTAWAFCYNLLIGHIRDQQYQELGEATRIGLEHFRNNPFVFDDAGSWALVIMGLVLSIGAMIDGRGWDEPWFGYERHHRRFRMAEEEYDFQKRELMETASEMKEDASGELRLLERKIGNIVTSMQNSIERKMVLARNYETYIKTNQEACSTLIQLYRDENKRNRNEPPPSYFQDSHNCDLGHKKTVDPLEHRKRLKQQTQFAAAAKKTRVSATAEIGDVYLEHQATVVSKGLSGLLENIGGEALPS